MQSRLTPSPTLHRFSPTFIRLDAFDSDRNLIGSTLSSALFSGARQTISVEFGSEVISYITAYSDETVVDDSGNVIPSSASGRLDRLIYTQAEAISQTDENGFYEITGIQPDEYEINFINSLGNRELSGAQPIPDRDRKRRKLHPTTKLSSPH